MSLLTHSGGPHKVADVNGSEPKKKKKEGGGGGKERKTYSVCLERCLKKKKKKNLFVPQKLEIISCIYNEGPKNKSNS